MKNTGLFIFLLAAVFNSIFSQPNGIPESIKIEVTNQVMAAYSDLAVVIDLAQMRQKYPGFNPVTCIVLSGEQEIPAQVNDIDNDGLQDELVFTAGFKAGENRRFLLAAKIGERISFFPVKRTQAEISHKTGGHWEGRKYVGGEFVNVNALRVPDEHTDHSFYIRYEGPGWESDKVGYRFYLDWRNAIDIFGKLTDTLVLQDVGLDGFDSYHETAPWGMDIFKVGKTLGLGSAALWKNDSVHMVSHTDSVICRIALNGPVESMIETRYYGWEVEDTRNDLISRLSIYAGSRVTEHHLTLKGDGGNLCTGLIRDKKADIILSRAGKDGWAYMATWGCQSLNNDSLGIAILYNTANLEQITEDNVNYIVVLKPENHVLHYNLLAAWEKEPGGIKTKTGFIAYLNSLVELMNRPLIIRF
jgi:hypothetical protein